MKHPFEQDDACYFLNACDTIVSSSIQELVLDEPLELYLVQGIKEKRMTSS